MDKVKQAFAVSQYAHSLGYATAVNRKGLVQFQTVTYAANGQSIVKPKSDWLTNEQAASWLKMPCAS